MFRGARVAYDFGPQMADLNLAFGVKNIFDQDYFIRSYDDNNKGIYAGQPRTLYMHIQRARLACVDAFVVVVIRADEVVLVEDVFHTERQVQICHLRAKVIRHACAPKHKGTLGVDYKPGNWTFNLNSDFQSSQFADNANTVKESADGSTGRIPG